MLMIVLILNLVHFYISKKINYACVCAHSMLIAGLESCLLFVNIQIAFESFLSSAIKDGNGIFKINIINS